MSDTSCSASKETNSRVNGHAFSGVRYLIGLQIFVKLATFAMNTVVIYIAGRRAFGVASVRFQLLLSTILFLSREGMRDALMRVSTSSSSAEPAADRPTKPTRQEQRIINAALVPIAAGMAMATGMYLFYVAKSPQHTESTFSVDEPHYRLSLAINIVAAWIELCVEPLFVLSRARALFKMQAQCEGIAVLCRCAVVVTTLLFGRFVGTSPDDNPLRLVAFAAGQLGYAIAIVAAFAIYMSHELTYPVWRCYVPIPVALGHGIPTQSYIDRTLGGLAATFVGQSLLKFFLTQGDNMVMARFATADEMGVFAFVSNYGSIPARVVFLPLEEASRAMFAGLASVTSTKKTDMSSNAGKKTSADLHSAKRVLLALGKLQFLLGSILVVFGTLYLPILVSLAQKSDSAVSQALVVYCLYLPFMGVNGFLEAFVHSVASRSQLLQINIRMAAFAVVYMVVAVQSLRLFNLGSAGIISANMLNMTLRIAYCKRFISQWFLERNVDGPQLASMRPHTAVIAACLLSGAVTVAASTVLAWLLRTALYQLTMLALGAVLGIAVLACIWRYEQPFIQTVRNLQTGQALHLKNE
ncbi:Oligosaccharide translocation protein rft1 [Coemansia guatemalensis]|uniref:Man(5)GlcNAc(2)-PP-dolichol translocation protein RFT1 n=1 Tax=Coemansia guatemalensis TaxID=2761395 RepID=A0A9W8I2F8_9FUNG|nr:Oligosaccharide translocation protein rft1 [Coemansia guatemalensis]